MRLRPGVAASLAPGVLDDLEQSYRGSAFRRRAALSMLERVGRQFAMRGIDWMAVKGTTQAALLYPDPVWRDSADIDLLVAPGQFSGALEALVEIGFVASYPPVPAHGFLRRAILGGVRDVMLVARADPRDSIELHRRLFFAGGRHADFLALPVLPGPVPMPAVGPDLAFYLIAHGALSYWVRLKWLVDLVPLLAKMDDQERLAILERASRARAESAVAASLLLVARAVSLRRAGATGRHGWRRKNRSPRCAAACAAMANCWAALTAKVILRSMTRWMMLEASGMLFEAPLARARLLLSAPLSSAMRRTAGILYRADRALTLQ